MLLTFAVVAAGALAPAQPAKLPVFMVWSANVASTAKIPGHPLPEHHSGFAAFQVDATRNMSAWVGAGQTYVADFAKQVVAFTQCSKSGTCACEYTCKLTDETACDSQLDGDALCGFDYENNAKWVGNVTIDSVPTMHYSYKDKLGPIPMASHDIYITVDSKKVVRFVANFKPFFKEVATITSDYTNFSTAAPPASAFEYSGADTCPDQTGEQECENAIKSARARGLRL